MRNKIFTSMPESRRCKLVDERNETIKRTDKSCSRKVVVRGFTTRIFPGFFVMALMVAVLGYAPAVLYAEAPNFIYGFVRNSSGVAVADVAVWYCTSSVPEEFSQCPAKQFSQSALDGRWVFSNPAPNLYYRIWATYPDSYSNTVTRFYSGGTVYWGELALALDVPPKNSAVKITSPNGGETFAPGSFLNILWDAYTMTPGALVNLTLFRSVSNPVQEAMCNTSGNCSGSTYQWVANVAAKTDNDGLFTWTIPGGIAPASDYFLRIYCYNDVTSQFCGRDDTDNPFRIGSSAFLSPPAPLPAVAPPAVLTPPVPPPVVVSGDAAKSIVAETADGVRVVVPPAAAAPGGIVTLAVAPSAQTPPDAASIVLSAVYDIVLKDQSGSVITNLQKEIEITLPYREEDFRRKNFAEDRIYPAYYDDAARQWRKIENYTQDAVSNVIIARVSHLTRFAIVAAADVTPPAAPSGIAVRISENGDIVLSWKNPIRDFHHAKIYRSERAGVLGAVVNNEIFNQEFTDYETGTGVLYYTIRAVDPAGNESLNKKQYSVRAQTVSAPSGGAEAAARFQNLRVGDAGERVRIVQEVLAGEGLYPAGLVRGSFDEYTKQAVILFQEKYAEDILTPAGLVRGTGIVGFLTWKKVGELRTAHEVLREKPEEPDEEARQEERAVPQAPQPGFFVRWWRALLLFFGW